MKPFYDCDGITIYHADCRDVLPTLAAGSVDLVLTDPPYGIGKADWDDAFPTWWLPEAERIAPALGLMPGTWNLLRCPESIGRLRYRWTLAAHLINGMTRGALGFGNWIPCVVYKRDMPDMPEAVQTWCRDFAVWCRLRGLTKRDLDRVCGTSDMGGWWLGLLPHRCQVLAAHQWEKIKATFSPPEVFDALTQPHPSDYTPKGDCKDFVVGREDKPDHPSPKPVNVITWFLDSLPSESVCDPFLGSGTTLVAAKQLNRRAIGIEIEERYCEIAANRLAQTVMALEV